MATKIIKLRKNIFFLFFMNTMNKMSAFLKKSVIMRGHVILTLTDNWC